MEAYISWPFYESGLRATLVWRPRHTNIHLNTSRAHAILKTPPKTGEGPYVWGLNSQVLWMYAQDRLFNVVVRFCSSKGRMNSLPQDLKGHAPIVSLFGKLFLAWMPCFHVVVCGHRFWDEVVAFCAMETVQLGRLHPPCAYWRTLGGARGGGSPNSGFHKRDPARWNDGAFSP